MLDVLIITGASKGIGASIATKCSTICRRMIVIASSPKIHQINFTSCGTTSLQLDLSDYDRVQHEVYKLIDKIPNINSIGIVCCASQLGSHGGVLDNHLSDLDKVYRCNLLGNLAVVKACADYIPHVKSRIVFFGGGGAAYGYPEFSGYALSKVATVRAAENLSMEFSKYDSSVIALAPGAVATDILDQVVAHGGMVKTRTDISEPTNFVYKFLIDELPSKELNGRFLHVRDDISSLDLSNADMLKLRRIQ
jgi:NAD(P)-dependent dehydrogenase (short-subunit alcohol dehydrogenase family)